MAPWAPKVIHYIDNHTVLMDLVGVVSCGLCKGLVTNYGEGVATKREGEGACEVLPLLKGVGAGKV